jgi:cytochrome c oxidase subunit 2
VKWAWTFKYPNGAQSDDLYVPAGRPVRLVMRSNDVLHSLYIPAFRVKRDVVPGRYTHLWFQSDFITGMDEGYFLFCTEYCGTGHSNMNRRVYVLGETEFNEWLEQQARWIDEIDDEELYFKAGPKIYARCSQCHSIDGSMGTGPSWKGLWEKVSGGAGSDQKFADGKSYSDIIGPGKEYATPEDYIRDSIYNPGKHLVSGYGNVMPTFKGQLSDRATDAVIGMLKRLDEFDAKGQWTKAAPAAK